MAVVAKSLPSKCEALSSNANTSKTKQNIQRSNNLKLPKYDFKS
jgi:hypothetical protein